MRKIKSGTRVYISEVGHNGFHYPSDQSILISEDTVVNLLPWVSSKEDDRLPVVIKSLAASPSTVWIKKSDLLDS